LATGEVRTATSDGRGVFQLNNLAPSRYDLTIMASAGFKAYADRNLELHANERCDIGQVQLALAGSLSEEISVTAATPMQTGAAAPARAAKAAAAPSAPLQGTVGVLFDGQPASAARNPGLRYQVLRLLPNGDYETLAGESLARGDTIKLRFTPNMAGYLHVAEPGARTPLLQTRVERMAEATTPAIKVGGSGRREFLVAFSAQEQPAASYEAAAVRSAAATVRTETVAQERATYVVGVAAASFVIGLDFK
jgi:hypothetical protein